MIAPIYVEGTDHKVKRLCEGTPKESWKAYWSQVRYNARFPFCGPRDLDKALKSFRWFPFP